MSKVSDPSAKGSNGFLIGLGALLLIVACVIGYVVWQGKAGQQDRLVEGYTQQDFNATVSYQDNVITLAADGAQGKAKEVDLYEDFSCPHCAELAEKTDDEMKDKIEAGELIVHIHPLNFLDDAAAGGQKATDGHSTRSVAATTKLAAAGDAKAYWNLRALLMEKQQNASTWDAQDFADAAKALGASDKAVSDMAAATPEDGLTVAHANSDKLQQQTGEVSSPRVLVDGKDVEGSIFDWITTVLS